MLSFLVTLGARFGPGALDARRLAAFAGILCITLTAAASPSSCVADEGPRLEPVTFVTSTGEHRFEVEVADNRAAQERGLMFRKSLGARQGMLFVYAREERVSMWMRNTYIPLDMVFVRANGRVHRIEHDTEPFSERIIDSEGPVSAVIEVNAGTARAIGLKPGDLVRNPRFAAETKR